MFANTPLAPVRAAAALAKEKVAFGRTLVVMARFMEKPSEEVAEPVSKDDLTIEMAGEGDGDGTGEVFARRRRCDTVYGAACSVCSTEKSSRW